jgi:phosphoadenosine phosphosulfate reductase
MTAEELLRWALDRFHPRIAFASSFGVEDVAVIHMLVRIRPDARIFTLDTGRLPEQTHDVLERIRAAYGVHVEVHLPDREVVERLVRGKGPFSFRRSVADRKECCSVRKVGPLGRALEGLDAWITGLRRDQAATRAAAGKVERDPLHPRLLKVNPIADWTEAQVWDYVRRHGVPYNALHDRGYPSIGCAPCTRPVPPGADPRSGRWWWEPADQKECGLHAAPARR